MTQSLIIQKLIDKENLTEEEAFHFFSLVMSGGISEILLSSFLTALKIKGETSEEITGFVRAIRNASHKPKHSFNFHILDTCGTGGDGKNSINISTLSALTLGSMGVCIAKHGNRSVSSLCGSSDFLDEFGYIYNSPHEFIIERIEKQKFTFLFAPHWHPAMKFAAPVRKELGFRTVFNILGPLTNPLNPSHQIVGVYSTDLIEVYARVLIKLGIKKAILCHSLDGMDEFSIFQPTKFAMISDNQIEYSEFDPNSLNLKGLNAKEVFALNRAESIQLSSRILKGEKTTGMLKVALNAGAGLFLMNRASSIEEGFHLCLNKLLSGEVLQYFQGIIQDSKREK